MVSRFFKNGVTLLQQKQNSVLMAAMMIMVSYAASMVLGLVRERLLVANFFECCSADLDVYYAAFRIPDMLFQMLVTGSLSAAFIPVFSQWLQKSEVEAHRIASTVLNGLIVSFGILSIPLFIFAPQLSELITGSFSPSQVALMATLTRIMLAAQLCFLFSSYMTGVLQSYHRFLLPALAPILYNLGIILGIVWFADSWGIYSPVIGVVGGAFLHAVVQVPLIRQLGFKYSWSWDFRIPAVREIGKLLIPRTLSLGINQIDATAAVFFATSLSTGSLVLFNLAQTLMQIPVKLVGIPISQAAFPSLSQASNKDKQLFAGMVIENLLQILYLVLPATAILLILRIPIVRLAYGASTFPWQATLLTGKTLAMFVLAIPLQALTQLLIRSFYAQKDTKTPLVAGIISVVTFLSLSYVLTFYTDLQLLGVAIATSVASLLQFGVLAVLLNKKVTILTQQLVIPIVKMLFTTLLMGTCLWIPMKLLDQLVFDTTRVLPLIALTGTAGCIGMAVYFSLSFGLGVTQQSKFFKLLYKLPATRRSADKIRDAWESLSSSTPTPTS